MFGKIGISILSLSVVMGCAKPNYQNIPDLTGETAAAQTCALAFSKIDLCVDLVWDQMPTDSVTGSFDLKFYTKESPTQFIDPAQTLGVQLWMPAMGHGSSPVQIQNTAPGVDHVTNVYFVMPGAWEIHVQLKNGADVVDEVVQNITY